MLFKLNIIILYSLFAFFISLLLYPFYILFLKKIKAGKLIREEGSSWGKAKIFMKLHWHKTWTPTMGGGVFLLVLGLLVMLSLLFQKMGYINNSLWAREETYIILFAFFSMWILWFIDDFLNIKGIWKIKWLTAKMKLLWMFLFSAFISYWFFSKLGISYINTWPINWEIQLGILYPIVTFFLTVLIVNAINIVDWLDGLVWGLVMLILLVLWIATFFYSWYLATTIIWIILWIMLAFLWFNINPAKIFMWDSWSLALGGLIATLIYLLNIKMGIFIPFLFLFSLFLLEISTSFLQICFKKIFKKKLFPIAPFHHYLEYKWLNEYTIVMKFWVIQWVLSAITVILIFYQFNLT